MTKLAERKAYDAGRALIRVDWPDDAPADQKRLGEHHCPFAEGDPQREPWLRGLRDALLDQSDEKERAALLKRLENV
jgi:hypothetical protein